MKKRRNCRYEDLLLIAELQAKTILSQQAIANKLLFSDTELMITKSHARFLFDRELLTKTWIAAANHFDLYLFLEPDCDFVQDGTRLDLDERNRLSEHHRAYFLEMGLTLHSINGDWVNRYHMAVDTVKAFFHV